MAKTSNLANALSTVGVASGNQPCRLCEKVNSLPPADAEALRGALERGISVQDLYEILRENGQRVVRRDIEKHKKGGHTV